MTFFEPLQLHLEPADLLEQLGLAGLGVSRGRLRRAAEDPLGPGQELLLPAVDQGRVDLELPGQLVGRAIPLEGGQGDLGLERRRVDLPLARHRTPFAGPPE
jgi:hypothetical protein